MIHPRLSLNDRRSGHLSWLGIGGLVSFLGCLPLSGCATLFSHHREFKQQAGLAQSRVKYELARQQFLSGRTEMAIETVTEAIRTNPTSTDQLLLLAQCNIELGQFVSAREAAQTAKVCDPDSAEVDYTLGVIAERTNNLERALDYYRRARTHRRSSVDYVVAEAECLTAMGRSSQAIALITDQIGRFDSDGTLEMLLAQIHLLVGDQDAALREYGFALERSACNAQRLRDTVGCALLIEEYGKLLSDKGRYGQAIALLGPYSESHDDAPTSVVFALATAYLETGQLPAAQRLLLSQTKRHPDNATCWLLLARASITANDWTTARRCADALQRVAPDSSRTHLIRGFVCWKQNDLEEAVDSLRQSLTIDPNDTEAHCLIGQVLESLGGDLSEARSHYERASELDPQYACARRVPSPQLDLLTPSDAPIGARGGATTKARLP